MPRTGGRGSWLGAATQRRATAESKLPKLETQRTQRDLFHFNLISSLHDLLLLLFASYCGLSSGRRFSVGRSSSLPLLLLPLLPLLPVRRNVGRLSLPLSLSLWRFSISASRALTLSNSEVSRMYSGRGGRTFEISCWDFSIRSGVCGCVSKVLAMKPGFFFCKASIFSKNEMKAWG